MSELIDDQVLQVAAHRFEAARQISGSLKHARRDVLHGHGFIVAAQAVVPSGWAQFEGSESHDLRTRLECTVSSLDYNLLNDVIAQPTDENIAAWIAARIDVPGLVQTSVQSTTSQGSSFSAKHGRTELWRRYAIHAAHKLPYVPVGHKCGRLHGHQFVVVVHACTDDSDSTISYDGLDALWAPLHATLNYCTLNELPGLENPTSEILSSWIWTRLKQACSAVTAVSVFETASCGATYDGVTYRIWKDFTLDSAVRMACAPSTDARARIHGHTYTARLNLTAPLDQVMGWTVDFGDIKTLFDPVFKSLDHHFLTERPGPGAW